MLQATYWLPGIGMHFKCTLKNFTDDRTIGLVINPLAFFFLHNFFLCVYTNLFNLGMQHSFAFQPEPQCKLVAWEQFKIISPVLRSIGIVITTCIGSIFIKITSFHIIASFKHQVFKKMRKAGAGSVFIFGSYMIQG